MDMQADQATRQIEAARQYLELVVSQKRTTGTEIARTINVSASTINKPLSDKPAKSPISIKTLNKVRKWSGVPYTPDVIEAYDLAENAAGVSQFRHDTAEMDYDYPASQALEPDLKVLGVSYCGSVGDFTIDHLGEAIDYVRRPPGLTKARDVFCVHIMGDSMLPWYRPGDILFLSEKRPAQAHSLVVVELHPENEGDPCPSLFKLMLRKNDEFVELQQSNPPKVFKVKMQKVKRIYRVLQNRELIGI